jgi:general secretion pathway protein J
LRRLVLREASGRETVLLEDIDRLELAYWRGAWVTRWEAAALPQLVRVRIVFPHGDPRHWPDILVAPRREPAAT